MLLTAQLMQIARGIQSMYSEVWSELCVLCVFVRYFFKSNYEVMYLLRYFVDYTAVKQTMFCFTIMMLFFNNYPAFSQETVSKNQLLKDAESYFHKEHFLASLPIYLKLKSIDSKIKYKFNVQILIISNY